MENKSIPYLVYEGAQARSERTIKRLTVALIVAIVLVFISNALWLYAWTSYDYVGEEISVDAQDGMANYIGERGNINIGTDYSTQENED